jgi:hypothetical protein
MIFGVDKKPSNKYAQTNINTVAGTITDPMFNPSEYSQGTVDASQQAAQAYLDLTKMITEITGGTGPAGAYIHAGEQVPYQVNVGGEDLSFHSAGRQTFQDAESALNWMVQEFAKGLTGVIDENYKTVIARGGTGEELLQNLQFVQSILDATAEAADPVATALKAVNDNFDLLEQRATDLGLSTELLTKLEAKRLEQIEEVNASYSLGAYQGVASALDQINNWMVAQQLSDTSSQNPLGRQALAQQEFEKALAAVQGGDLTQTGSLTSSASSLLGIARANYGSTAGFTSIEQYVQSSLADVGQSIGSQQSMADQIAKAIQLSTQTNAQKQNEIIAAIEKLNQNIKLLADKAAA